MILIVSGGQQRNSAIHTHVSILLQTRLPSRLPCNLEQSSLCYTVRLYWLSILNTAVCTCPSQTPYLFPLIMLYFYIWQTAKMYRFLIKLMKFRCHIMLACVINDSKVHLLAKWINHKCLIWKEKDVCVCLCVCII